jgi:8-oxo-dGTP pyrophosphatase MutT (NUDIX family)
MSNSEKIIRIRKVSALWIDKQNRLLIVQSKGRDIWISLGGKPEFIEAENRMETDEECIKREVEEEAGIAKEHIHPSKELFIATPYEPAANKQGIEVQMNFYLCTIDGEVTKTNDASITDSVWITREWFEENYRLGAEGKYERVESKGNIKRMPNELDRILDIGSGLRDFAIPKLIELGLMK